MLKLLSFYVVAATMLAGALSAAPPERIAVDRLRPGMKGTGYTVLEGSEIKAFDVEILGVMRNAGPKRDMIIGRLSGIGLEDSGIVAGMSGSPVYIDGKLAGAVSSGWPFSKTPIVGITPIEDMLRVSGAHGKGPGDHALRALAARYQADYLVTRVPPELAGAAEETTPLTGAGDPSGMRQLSTPLVFGGFPDRWVDAFGGLFGAMGFLPLQGRAAGSDEAANGDLKPGSPVAVDLIRGDLSVAAYGTVTAVEGNQVFGFGHPLFNLGEVDLPLSSAKIEAVVPSYYWSFKLASAGGVIGRLRQDRVVGIHGVLGGRPNMIDTHVTLSGNGTDEKESFDFSLADHRLLSPLLLEMSLASLFDAAGGVAGENTVRLSARISLAHGGEVRFEDSMAGSNASTVAAYVPAAIVSLLSNNPYKEVKVGKIAVDLAIDDQPRIQELERIKVAKGAVRPGDTVKMTLFVKEQRGGVTARSVDIRVPSNQPDGHMSVLVGSGAYVQEYERRLRPVIPSDLDQLIAWINQLRKNERFYVLLLRNDRGLSIKGSRMTLLPPSVFTALATTRSLETVLAVKRAVTGEYEVPVDGVASGVKLITLNVRR